MHVQTFHFRSFRQRFPADHELFIIKSPLADRPLDSSDVPELGAVAPGPSPLSWSRYALGVAVEEALFSYQTAGWLSGITLSHHEILMNVLLYREAAITTQHRCWTGRKVCSSPPGYLGYLFRVTFVSLSGEFCLVYVRMGIWL